MCYMHIHDTPTHPMRPGTRPALCQPKPIKEERRQMQTSIYHGHLLLSDTRLCLFLSSKTIETHHDAGTRRGSTCSVPRVRRRGRVSCC
jgi:hypothetical protein